MIDEDNPRACSPLLNEPTSLDDVMLEAMELREAVFEAGRPELVPLVEALMLRLGCAGRYFHQAVRYRAGLKDAA